MALFSLQKHRYFYSTIRLCCSVFIAFFVCYPDGHSYSRRSICRVTAVTLTESGKGDKLRGTAYYACTFGSSTETGDHDMVWLVLGPGDLSKGDDHMVMHHGHGHASSVVVPNESCHVLFKLADCGAHAAMQCAML
jgi:hypothetical protein